MIYGAGSLTLAARRSGDRTVLERVHYDGISRCSRAFAQGNAARVVLSQLGPGVVRGDDVTTVGQLAAGAHLIVTAQTSTRLMGGGRPARAHAHWRLAPGALLELVGEPLVANPDARYTSFTTVELGAGSFVVLSELAAVPRAAAVRLQTTVSRGGRELWYDAFDAGVAAPNAVGTFAAIGLDATTNARVVAALDAAADALADPRLGIGALPSGAFARVIGADPWSVRATLGTLRAAAFAALAAQAVVSSA